MQRVRIGLTGLCTVFLLVLLAAAVFGLAPADNSVRQPRTDPATGNAAADDPKDPLAELGVTPGGSQSDVPAAPPPAPPRPAVKPAP